jgi:hypothetical protein
MRNSSRGYRQPEGGGSGNRSAVESLQAFTSLIDNCHCPWGGFEPGYGQKRKPFKFNWRVRERSSAAAPCCAVIGAAMQRADQCVNA